MLFGRITVGLLIASFWCADSRAEVGGKSSRTERTDYIFYPPAPEQPRLQFLASYSTDLDVGKRVSKLDKFLTGEQAAKFEILKPYGLAFNKGRLFICDVSKGGIAVLDPEKRVLTLADPRIGSEVKTPINLCFDETGELYVADRGKNQVLIFGPDGQFQGAFGKPAGSGNVAGGGPQPSGRDGDKEIWPCDVAIIKDRFYVADLNNNCVRICNKATREEAGRIPSSTNDTNAVLFAPTNLAADRQGCLYVSDFGGFCVKKYDADGRFIRQFGGPGDRPGEFVRPKGIAVDRENRLYVVDSATQVVQIFDDQGRLLLYFGEPNGSAAPLNMPARVIIDYDHVAFYQSKAAPDFRIEYLVIVSNQYGPRKVSIYGFGHRQ